MNPSTLRRFCRDPVDPCVSIWYSFYGKEIDMDTVTVSTKFQVVIPRRVRERMRLRPGEKLQVISFDDRIELIPVRPMSQMRGFLKGFDRSFKREKEDRA